MPLTYKTMYGIDWEPETPDYHINLTMARFGWSPRAMNRYTGAGFKTAMELGIADPGDCMIRGIRGLLTPEEFSLNRWSEETLYALTNEEETILAGAASCGKSHTTGLWAYVWWSMAPKTTMCFLGSTSVQALRRRTFTSVARYHGILKKRGGIGIFSRSLCAVVNEDEDREGVTSEDISSGIQGIAFFGSKSPEDQATKIGGTHMSTVPGSPDDGNGSVAIILDEMQALPGEAISRFLTNASSGTEIFRICGSGNFNNRTDMLGERAEPAIGWAAVSMDEDKSWRTTRGGLLIRFDAYDSPAVIEPDGENKYPFLVGPRHIQRMLNEVKGNENDPKFLSMARAWPRLEDETTVVFPIALQARHKVRMPAVWRYPDEPREVFLAVDPAYTASGDHAAYCIMEVGIFDSGIRGINIRELNYIKIDARSTTPVAYQITNAVVSLARNNKIPPGHIAVDSSANQLVGDILIMELGDPDVLRINYAGAATENPLTEFSEKKAREYYGNLITELWYRVVDYSVNDQLRGLPPEASRQFAQRELSPRLGKILLLKKSEHKKKYGSSPDDADVVAMGLHAVRERLRLVPGETTVNRFGVRASIQRKNTFGNTLPADYQESDYGEEENG